jgi:hypothetical protein
MLEIHFVQITMVPRALSLIGILGALPLIEGYTATIFGLIDCISPLADLSVVPVAVFEFSLGVYLVGKGFKNNSTLLLRHTSSSATNSNLQFLSIAND